MTGARRGDCSLLLVVIRNEVALGVRLRIGVITIGEIQLRHVEDAETASELVPRAERGNVDGADFRVGKRKHLFLQGVDAADDEHLPVADNLAGMSVAGMFGFVAHFEPAERGQAQDKDLVPRNGTFAKPAIPASVDEAVRRD